MQERLSSVRPIQAGSGPPGATPGICVFGPGRTPNTSFVVATEWLASGVPVVSVSGELDATTASTLEGTLLTLPDHTAQAVIVDLARCEFIDLRGLHVLLAARKRLERSNRQLELVCGNPHLLRVLKITRCDGLFQIWPSLTVAAEAADDG